MKYKKKFNKDRTKVTITATKGSKGFWYSEKREREKKKTFEVVEKEKIYEWIKNGEIIDLKDKYVQGFSLDEYRQRERMKDDDPVPLKGIEAGGAFFAGGANFYRATFEKEDVYFPNATFEEGNTSFELAIFGSGYTSFELATFERGNVSFEGATFGVAITSFAGATFGEGKVVFKNLKLKTLWDMRFVQADIIDFSLSILQGDINLIDSKVNSIIFINTIVEGKIYLKYEDFKLADAINNQPTNHTEKGAQFQLMKENFIKIGQPSDADKTQMLVMKHKLRGDAGFIPGQSMFKKIKKLPNFTFKWLFYEFLGADYATNPLKLIFAMISTWFTFSMIYFLSGNNFNIKGKVLESDSLKPIAKLGYSMYHSAITFLTIGYGDVYPGCAKVRIISSIEGFFGILFVAYLSVVISRKLLR